MSILAACFTRRLGIRRSSHNSTSASLISAAVLETLENRRLLSGLSFGAASTVAVSGPANSAVAADLNGDGKLDLVTVNYNGTISVALGSGNGTFAASQTISDGLGNGPGAVAVGDFNNDSNPDLVVTNQASGTIAVLLGNGDGTFAAPESVTVSSYPMAVAVADVNGDGDLDILTANYNGTVNLLLGNGNGTFAAASTYQVNGHAGTDQIVAGDFNGDGTTDIAVANGRYGTVSILLGESGEEGFYGFGTATTITDGLPRGQVFMTSADLNRDGNPDLVVASGSGQIDVLLGNSAGGFVASAPLTVGSRVYGLGTADFNGDGNPDLVVSTRSSVSASGNVTIFLGNGDGTFQSPVNFTGANTAGAIAVGDFNSDGKPDVAQASYSFDDSVSIVPDTSTGLFFAPQATTATSNHPEAIATGDLNGDGNADLVTAGSDGSLQVFLGNGDGTFKTPSSYAIPNTATSVVIADVNGDGKADIIVALPYESEIAVLLGNGNGTFSAPVYTSVTSIAESTSEPIAAGDFNNDGKADLAIDTDTAGQLAVYLSNGDGHFHQQGTYSVGGSPELSVTVGDLKNNGHLDIVSTDTFSDEVYVLINNGDGTFQAPVEYDVEDGPGAVALADLTGNGNLDIVTANKYSDSISVLLGNGDGTFGTAQNFAAGNNPYAIAVSDFNGDGNQDVAVSTHSGGQSGHSLHILLGNGDGTFQSPIAFQTGNSPRSLVAANINGDGKPDLAVANAGEYDFGVLTNTGAPNGTIAQNGATVTATGNNGSGSDSVGYSGGMIVIDLDGQTQSFAGNTVATINIALGDGDDSISVGSSVPCTLNITGGMGDDTIMAMNSMPDSISGVAGNNSIAAGTGVDMLRGGTGNDSIEGGGSGTEIMGGPGSDVVDPMTTNETVRGGQGNDTVVGDPSGDSLRGGVGDDIFINGAGAGDVIDGGQGLNFAQNNSDDSIFNVFEVFDPTAPAPSTSSIASAADRVVPENSSVTAVVVGTELKIVGTSGADTITLSSDGTDLTVDSGGTGIDTVPLSGLTAIRINAGDGNNVVNVGASVFLSATVLGGSGDDSLVGGGGDNVLVGGAGNDTLVGGGGTNLLIPGDKAFEGSTGSDVLEGGIGYTIADFSRRTDPLFLSNDGTDNSGDAGAGETTTIAANVSAIWGGVAADTIVGTTAGEFLSGGSGPDSIHGGGVSDVLVGGVGKDTVAAAAEPVSLFLRDGRVDDYSGITDPATDILQLDSNDVLEG